MLAYCSSTLCSTCITSVSNPLCKHQHVLFRPSRSVSGPILLHLHPVHHLHRFIEKPTVTSTAASITQMQLLLSPMLLIKFTVHFDISRANWTGSCCVSMAHMHVGVKNFAAGTGEAAATESAACQGGAQVQQSPVCSWPAG